MNLSTALDNVKNNKENAFEKLLTRVSKSHKFHVKTMEKNRSLAVCLTFENGNKFYFHGGFLFGFCYGLRDSGYLRVVKISNGNSVVWFLLFFFCVYFFVGN